MILFENRAKKINKDSFSEVFGFNLNENPYTASNLKEEYSHFPKQYFSGWQDSSETIFKDYESGKTQLVSTNYMTSLSTRSSLQANQASKTLENKLGFPVRTVISSFITTPPLIREYHYDYYDGILFNFSGTKTLCVHSPLDLYPEEIYRYSNKAEDHANPGTSFEKFTLNSGDALYIPAFAHHLVDNVGDTETAACSFVFDTSALLIDIFRTTLELCSGQLRTQYQPRSMCGPRVYWNLARWKCWSEELNGHSNTEPKILGRIIAELAHEFPEIRDQLLNNSNIRKSLREEWSMFILHFDRVRFQKLINH
jgi:hypothetical protein